MNNNFDAVLWDMDGTLADTGELHYQTWLAALNEAGYDMSPQQFKTTFGMNSRAALRYLYGDAFNDEQMEHIIVQKETIYRLMLPGSMHLLPGVQHWLDWLRDHHIPQAMASSAPDENIQVFVDDLGIREYFAALVAGFDMPAKPAPDIFLLAAEKLGVPPSRCLVMEDSLAGVQAAQSAGMRCIAVTTTNPREALCHACQVVDTLEELDPENIF